MEQVKVRMIHHGRQEAEDIEGHKPQEEKW